MLRGKKSQDKVSRGKESQGKVSRGKKSLYLLIMYNVYNIKCTGHPGKRYYIIYPSQISQFQYIAKYKVFSLPNLSSNWELSKWHF